MKQNLEDTLLNQVDRAKESVMKKLFDEFKTNSDADMREEIYSKVNVLDKVIYQLKSEIRKFDK